MEQLRGTGVALITPFKEDLSVDVDALRRVTEHCIDGGVDYLVILGTTAESVTLTADEKTLVIDIIQTTNAGRLPLVLGVGGNNTTVVVNELQSRDLSAFDAILSVSPYYNRPTQEGIYQHFKAIALASSKPIILYNVPGRTGSNVLPETVLRLAKEFDNIVAVKEASGSMAQIMKIIKHKPNDFMVLSGDDLTALPTVLAGGSGVISVLGQGLPSEFAKMIRLGLERRVDEAYEIHYSIQDGMELIFEEGNPAGIKAIFEILALSTAKVRLPLVEATATLKQKITAFVKPFLKVYA
ncbi:4-hydroxy-tetrahydrodipicolinate synthase [Kriegella aquimaris]|uniref:4-hydroxy-tetrahydrodipicolinate synthase n=1 Tax=Kriegella aquimaris TaxID=192904 RepID=A0A1G9K5S2_9FLAO|nr:4-hydroxy-tetrahydrodipicolinate synthase [Kriegella aquimaris]SDL45019.1 4-hydroxy-tetrahydrodipicolinate synthase [Kriegella aquimaris]